MNEYTFADLIINPETPNLESLIGKEVYCNDVPLACLDHANEHRGAGILREVRRESADYPFRVETSEGGILGFVCIIPKKEEPKLEYVPFESKKEFVERYKEVMEGVEFGSFEDNLFQCGMWLKHADDDPSKSVYRLVSLIKDEGVRISEWGFFDWGELLLAGFLFLDNTPCGKLAGAEHE